MATEVVVLNLLCYRGRSYRTILSAIGGLQCGGAGRMGVVMRNFMMIRMCRFAKSFVVTGSSSRIG